jgi:hypothetical protein
MIKQSLQHFFSSLRSLFADKGALAILAGLYALLLGTVYGFIAIREATVIQVLLTLLFIGLTPVLFFLMQATIIGHARTGRIDWSAALRASTKLALVTIPVILVGVGAMWLLNKWQGHYLAPPLPPSPPPLPGAPHATKSVPPVYWPSVLFATARIFIFGVLLPLALIQLWIATAGQNLRAGFSGGWRSTLTRFGQLLARFFSPGSLIIYVLGVVLFALIPYALLFGKFPTKGAWTDIVLFTIRIVVVLALIFLGWVITLRAFTKIDGGEVSASPVQDQPLASPPTTVDQPEMSTV